MLTVLKKLRHREVEELAWGHLMRVRMDTKRSRGRKTQQAGRIRGCSGWRGSWDPPPALRTPLTEQPDTLADGAKGR